jgi:parallel beta-helix repeat protein
MKTAAVGRAGAATDPGLERSINEDRVFADDARGLFMVVDGLGGHAAGETAAETAVTVIAQQLGGSQTIDEDRIRDAIAAANNKIFELSAANAAWRGMACVLTLAVSAGDEFIIGHVGDSRLYLYWNGKLHKITCDHSPVGELEDAGELTEDEAMSHPRRNEVYRDVGSYLHAPDDPRFIEIKRIRFHPDAALLLCSDGLTDLVKAADISRILERYDGDSMRIAQLLIEAANAAGGRDNISAVFVPGPEFVGSESSASNDVRARHATTRMRSDKPVKRNLFRNVFLLLIGMALCLAGWRWFDRYQNQPAPVAVQPASHVPKEIVVEAADPSGILKALAIALPGDTIAVPGGDYLGPVQLKERVTIAAQSTGRVVVRADPFSASDPGVAVVARHIKEGRVKGLHLVADDTHPLKYGLVMADSSIQIEDVEVSGATEAGLRIEGDSHPLIVGSSFHSNAGPGVVIRGSSSPQLTGNRIAENGRVPGALRAGIEIDNEAVPTLLRNDILQNGAPPLFPLALDEEIRAKNTVVDAAGTKKSTKPRAPVVKPPKPAVSPRSVVRPLTQA